MNSGLGCSDGGRPVLKLCCIDEPISSRRQIMNLGCTDAQTPMTVHSLLYGPMGVLLL